MALARDDLEAAREAFFAMPVAGQDESLTRYIAFKLAVKSNDYELALESLNIITKQAKNDHTYLYACVLVAQQSQMLPIAVAALQAILDKKPPTEHLPTLLRCTARLLIGELGANDSRSLDEVMGEVVHIFENAVENIAELRKGSADEWRAEVQWWSKNAYNLSLQFCEKVNLELLVRLLAACTKFIESYLNDGGAMHQDDLSRRKALCHFLSANALVVLGRAAEGGSEYSLQAYLQARQQIGAFGNLCAEMETTNEDNINFKAKRLELLKLDLECILHLQQWHQLDATLQACLEFKEVERWDTLADIVLVIREHTQLGDNSTAKTNKLLERIINDTWQRDKDILKASRWLRVSFNMDLHDGSGDFALKLLHQAAGMAKRGYKKERVVYPETELQWLSTTAFNRAIDLLSSGVVDGSKEWIQGALELARYADDEGALHRNLTEKNVLVMERIREMEKQ